MVLGLVMIIAGPVGPCPRNGRAVMDVMVADFGGIGMRKKEWQGVIGETVIENGGEGRELYLGAYPRGLSSSRVTGNCNPQDGGRLPSPL